MSGDAAEQGLLSTALAQDSPTSRRKLDFAANEAAMSEDSDGVGPSMPAPSWRRGTLQAALLAMGFAATAALCAHSLCTKPEARGVPAPSRMATVVISDAEKKDAEKKAAEVAKGQACHTAEPGESCFKNVVWAATEGIKQKPKNYRGLHSSSTFTDFQAYFHKVKYGNCSKPCAGPGPDLKKLLRHGHCLCLFDVDRTLTGKQGAAAHCPGNQAHPGVVDTAFAGGDLVLSDLGLNLKSTFCGKCHVGVVSQGGAGGPEMKAVLQAQLPSAGAVWSAPSPITSPLVIGCADPLKPQCAKDIVDWYRGVHQISIAPKDVYFFDDHTGNVNGFGAMGYNARQVSCGSRDGVVGLCGAKAAEVVKTPGIAACHGG